MTTDKLTMKDPLTRVGISDLLDRVVCGDNCDVLGTLPRECIDLVVTSPPYDSLREYGGHSWDFFGVAWQLKRVLKPGGVIVWVVADQTKDGSETGTSMEQALHFKRLGLNLHDTMIYSKAGTGACGSNDAYWQAWEYMLVISNGKPKTINRLHDRLNRHAGKVATQGNGEKMTSIGTRSERGARIVPETSVRQNIWQYAAHYGETTAHPAPFPAPLARDHILSWSNPGDIVLDPFAGSGTTCKAAKELGRKFIGIEINPEYCQIAEKRLAQEVLPMMCEAV